MRFLVLLKTEPFYIRCLTERDALHEAERRKDDVLAIARSESEIILRTPRLRMVFEEDKEIHLDKQESYMVEKHFDDTESMLKEIGGENVLKIE